MVLYTSEKLSKIWDKGFITIAHFSWSTAAYVARYITKKYTGLNSDIHYGILGQIPEFTRMSNRPGIGKKYYEEHKNEIYENDELIMKTCKEKVLSVKPPKYYDSLYDIDYPEDMQKIKLRRQYECEQAQKVKDFTTSLSREKQLELEERDLETRIKSLVREF